VFYRFKYLLIQQIRKICVKRLEPLRIERRAQSCYLLGDLRGTDRELLPACPILGDRPRVAESAEVEHDEGLVVGK
jgi:hypothetical protein